VLIVVVGAIVELSVVGRTGATPIVVVETEVAEDPDGGIQLDMEAQV